MLRGTQRSRLVKRAQLEAQQEEMGREQEELVSPSKENVSPELGEASMNGDHGPEPKAPAAAAEEVLPEEIGTHEAQPSEVHAEPESADAPPAGENGEPPKKEAAKLTPEEQLQVGIRPTLCCGRRTCPGLRVMQILVMKRAICAAPSAQFAPERRCLAFCTGRGREEQAEEDVLRALPQAARGDARRGARPGDGGGGVPADRAGHDLDAGLAAGERGVSGPATLQAIDLPCGWPVCCCLGRLPQLRDSQLLLLSTRSSCAWGVQERTLALMT